MPSHTVLKAQFRVLMYENENDSLFHPAIHGMEDNPGDSIDVRLTRKTIQYYGLKCQLSWNFLKDTFDVDPFFYVFIESVTMLLLFSIYLIFTEG